jgi:hypothetical protein
LQLGASVCSSPASSSVCSVPCTHQPLNEASHTAAFITHTSCAPHKMCRPHATTITPHAVTLTTLQMHAAVHPCPTTWNARGGRRSRFSCSAASLLTSEVVESSAWNLHLRASLIHKSMSGCSTRCACASSGQGNWFLWAGHVRRACLRRFEPPKIMCRADVCEAREQENKGPNAGDWNEVCIRQACQCTVGPHTLRTAVAYCMHAA